MVFNALRSPSYVPLLRLESSNDGRWSFLLFRFLLFRVLAMEEVMEEVMDGVIDAMAGLPTGTMALCCSLVLPILGVYNELELIPNV